MSEADQGLELWAVLLIIFSTIAALLSFVACCVVRCFRPDGERGPQWYPTKEGKTQLVKGVFRSDRPLEEPTSEKNRWLVTPA
jgi:hypothetical protein